MRDINFLDSNQVVQKKSKSGGSKATSNSPLKIILLILTIIFILSGAGAYFFMDYMIKDFRNKMSEIDVKIKKYSVVTEIKNSIEDYNKKSNCMSEVLELISTNAFINTSVIQGISSVMPDNVFLLNYSITQAGQITLEGNSNENEGIAYFAHRLNETGLFEKVEVKSITNEAKENSKVPNYYFLIEVKIKY